MQQYSNGSMCVHISHWQTSLPDELDLFSLRDHVFRCLITKFEFWQGFTIKNHLNW